MGFLSVYLLDHAEDSLTTLQDTLKLSQTFVKERKAAEIRSNTKNASRKAFRFFPK